MSVFVNQTLLLITAETGYTDIASATVKRIVYRKPNGDGGYWDATIVGTTLTYQIQEGDIDQKGVWHFQAYWEVGGKKGEGSLKGKYFLTPL